VDWTGELEQSRDFVRAAEPPTMVLLHFLVNHLFVFNLTKLGLLLLVEVLVCNMVATAVNYHYLDRQVCQRDWLAVR